MRAAALQKSASGFGFRVGRVAIPFPSSGFLPRVGRQEDALAGVDFFDFLPRQSLYVQIGRVETER